MVKHHCVGGRKKLLPHLEFQDCTAKTDSLEKFTSLIDLSIYAKRVAYWVRKIEQHLNLVNLQLKSYLLHKTY